MLRQGLNINEMISASRGADRGRPSPIESGDRSAGTDPPSSAKDSKNFLSSFLSRKKKQKEDSPDSPESPAMNFKPSSLGSRAGNASDTSLVHPGSSFSTQGYASGKRYSPSRLYVLATANHWDYRMIDVTDVDSAGDMRQLICINLGLPDAAGALMFLTELGRFVHDNPLDDLKLLAHKRLKADGAGTLKLFVQHGGMNTVGYNVTSSATQGLLSPSYLPSGVAVDEDTYARLYGQRPRSSSSPPSSRQNSMVPTEASEKVPEQGAGDYRAEMERKGQAYMAKRRQASSRESSPQEVSSYGIVGRNVNFDQPRGSPFDDKGQDKLLPQRRAPAPPGDPSATLIKANSLSRKSGERMRASRGSIDESPLKRQLGGGAAPEMSEKGARRRSPVGGTPDP